MTDQKTSSVLTAPLHAAASMLRKMPGAEAVGRAAEGTLDKVGAVTGEALGKVETVTGEALGKVETVTGEALGKVEAVTGEALDKIGAVSPRGRRMAVYAGAGVLGVAGVVEWPVALTGAAVAWLTQSRSGNGADGHDANGEQRAAAEDSDATSPPPPHDIGSAALRSGTHPGSGGAQEPPGPVHSSHAKGSSGRLGPTARPERTNL
ncbi:hypothetical protein OIB37_04600 [Streptomyces sp. NBC_00820]|uniref:hypothetical protein n=1 Tax=Streptomyces sp. NBC_00820 TaxID=2975842 RepID=UPI002ED3FEC3|nr:hypothetical protein OIB37_04600 [Streptomyces sp. NBC_00820]